MRLAPDLGRFPEVSVPVPTGFASRRFSHEPSRPSKGTVLAVGVRAIVRSRREGFSRVPVTGEDGTVTLATLADGVEVEITAWRPRRTAGALYRVRTIADGKEGWVNASSLELVPQPRERPAPQPPSPSARTNPSATKNPRRAPAPAR
jgi:hypothetical protein